jgi:predicted  nucleic acid-binding Zn ribbon protein
MIEKECVKKIREAEETLERTKRELSDEIEKEYRITESYYYSWRKEESITSVIFYS